MPIDDEFFSGLRRDKPKRFCLFSVILYSPWASPSFLFSFTYLFYFILFYLCVYSLVCSFTYLSLLYHKACSITCPTTSQRTTSYYAFSTLFDSSARPGVPRKLNDSRDNLLIKEMSKLQKALLVKHIFKQTKNSLFNSATNTQTKKSLVIISSNRHYIVLPVQTDMQPLPLLLTPALLLLL